MGYHFYNPHDNKVSVARYAELFENSLKFTRSSRSLTLLKASESNVAKSVDVNSGEMAISAEVSISAQVAIPVGNIGWQYWLEIPAGNTGWQYRLAIPAGNTGWQYRLAIPASVGNIGEITLSIPVNKNVSISVKWKCQFWSKGLAISVKATLSISVNSRVSMSVNSRVSISVNSRVSIPVSSTSILVPSKKSRKPTF
ncbi:hypothetical protein Tco_0434718 [Tanacetum coccineum]